jgi:hypothetical protein
MLLDDSPLSDIESRFELYGEYQLRFGPAYAPGPAPCNLKLCYVATDKDFLVRWLDALARRPDCYAVKYSTSPKDGMYLGRCFLTTREAIGALWSEHKHHPKLMCSAQDDDFTIVYRNLATRK